MKHMDLSAFRHNEFPLNVTSWVEHVDWPLHTHDYMEIAIAVHGTGITEIDGVSFKFHAGDIFVIHPGSPHAYTNMNDATLINVAYASNVIDMNRITPGALPGYQALFSIEPALREKHGLKPRLTLTPDQMVKVRALTDTMEEEQQKEKPGYRLVVSGCFLNLIALLSRFYSETKTPDTKNMMKLAAVLSHLEEHYAEPIRIDDLVNMAHMSRRAFYSAFQDITQHPPGTYLRNLRIRKAVELLQTTGLSITEIAFSCGFESSSYFSRQFTKVMKTGPRAFRNQQRTHSVS